VFPAFRPPPPSPTTLAIVDLLHDRSKSGACVSCHREPFDDGAALVNENVIPRRRSSRSAPTSSSRVRLRGRHRRVARSRRAGRRVRSDRRDAHPERRHGLSGAFAGPRRGGRERGPVTKLELDGLGLLPPRSRRSRSAAPSRHDGRVTTLTEAAIEPGGEATASRNAARNLRPADQAQPGALLESLVLSKIPEPD
jgi:hypothetical protein